MEKKKHSTPRNGWDFCRFDWTPDALACEVRWVVHILRRLRAVVDLTRENSSHASSAHFWAHQNFYRRNEDYPHRDDR